MKKPSEDAATHKSCPAERETGHGRTGTARATARAMLLSALVVLSVTLLAVLLLSLNGILSWDTTRSAENLTFRVHRGALELRIEPALVVTTEYLLARTSGDRWRLPGFVSIGDYEITFLSPSYEEDLRQGHPWRSIPPHVLAKYGPPPLNVPAKRVRVHLWPFVLLTALYPFLVFVRFSRPIHATRRPALVTLVGATLLTLASGVSFLLLVSAAILWVRSSLLHYVEETLWTSFRPASDGSAKIGTTWIFALRNGNLGLGRVVSTHSAGRDMQVVQEEHQATYTALFQRHGSTMAVKRTDSLAHQLGFAFASGRGTVNLPSGGTATSAVRTKHAWLSVPCWLPLTLSAVLPIAWWRWCRRTWRTRWRFWRGQCLHCGYALTGNTSGVCPECGTAIRTTSQLPA